MSVNPVRMTSDFIQLFCFLLCLWLLLGSRLVVGATGVVQVHVSQHAHVEQVQPQIQPYLEPGRTVEGGARGKKGKKEIR